MNLPDMTKVEPVAFAQRSTSELPMTQQEGTPQLGANTFRLRDHVRSTARRESSAPPLALGYATRWLAFFSVEGQLPFCPGL